MFSTVAHLCQPTLPSNYVPKKIQVAAWIDLAGLITAVVLGALAISGAGGLPIGAMGGNWLIGGGLVGLAILAVKNIRPHIRVPTRSGVDNNARYYEEVTSQPTHPMLSGRRNRIPEVPWDAEKKL